MTSKSGDLLYLDPPYQNETNQYYSGMIDFAGFFKWLRHQRGDHLLSLDGYIGDENRTISVPEDLYEQHVQIKNGDNPFDRLNGKATRAVSDSLYIKARRPAGECEQQPSCLQTQESPRSERRSLNPPSQSILPLISHLRSPAETFRTPLLPTF